MEMRIFGTIIMANILVVGPHPDDQEIGMGGTIARLAHQGHNILLCDVTDGSPTPRGDRASRLVEARAALEHRQRRHDRSCRHTALDARPGLRPRPQSTG